MPRVQYGEILIEYRFIEEESLKSHYISVERGIGVTLKGSAISTALQEKLILKKARWILEKLELVEALDVEEIVTGSRLQYLGRKYYVEVVKNVAIQRVEVVFTHSRFVIRCPENQDGQYFIQSAIDRFIQEKAEMKITQRMKKVAKETGLSYAGIVVKRMDKRWGSCSGKNIIHIHSDVVKLPYKLIDYILVHELAHTIHKDHSKTFWAEVARHIPLWKTLDEQMSGMKL
ncbi:M48 family metallopeptidase [Halosquirtibacter laminarini]|uniref:M48 family metallopeptidase n=1 Tax=Halosquirtibacter laminarini TaxID=3374600 RepID=A0AC61NEQ2_9BACT|nr:M48 family metallopeptidase [Prolixibacteraceae bacterium]